MAGSYFSLISFLIVSAWPIASLSIVIVAMLGYLIWDLKNYQLAQPYRNRQCRRCGYLLVVDQGLHGTDIRCPECGRVQASRDRQPSSWSVLIDPQWPWLLVGMHSGMMMAMSVVRPLTGFDRALYSMCVSGVLMIASCVMVYVGRQCGQQRYLGILGIRGLAMVGGWLVVIVAMPVQCALWSLPP